MKYCSKCKRLHNDEETVCKNCKAHLKTITDENTPRVSAHGIGL